MDIYFPPEIEQIIWGYKHSAEMYDVALQFKKWFYVEEDSVDGRLLTCINLYGYPAFNYRPRPYINDFIFNIFQANSHEPVGFFGTKTIDLDYCKLFEFNTIPNLDENRKINWRQQYIDRFNL